MPESQEPKKVINNDLPNSQFAGGLINAETVNAGRIGGDIWNIVNIVFGRQKAADILAKNRQLLLAQVKQEVASRLEQSLHNAVLINLGKESQPQQVKRLWDAEVKIGLKPPEPIPDTTRIIDVFDSVDVAGKLLILGAPGAGKTTTQLELAQALVSRAEEQPDYPVPVLFNLSSWKDDRQPLTNWLLAELKSKYGVSKKLGKNWVDNHQLLPLLDGLDELESQRQELCVHAINKLLAGENRPLYIIICSRSEEYDNYETDLLLNGAICLKPLTNNQIQDYLNAVNYANLWQTINTDPNLLELVKTPLLLSITVLAFQEISIDNWQHQTSTTNRLQHLLDAYVRRMLTREIKSFLYSRRKVPTARQTRYWLGYLARHLQRESQTDFLIEKMQPNSNWLQTSTQKWVYFIGVSLISGVIVELTVGLVGGLMTGVLSIELIVGILCGLLVGLASGSSETIKPVETQVWSWSGSKAQKLLFIGMSGGAIFGLAIGLVGHYFHIIAIEPITGLISGLISGLIGGLVSGLNNKLTSLHINKRIVPNQGIWKSAVNARNFVLITVLIILVIFLWFPSFLRMLPTAALLGLVGLYGGGLACIQHFTLRFIVWWNGNIPWNYAHFLDYATERLFLQKIGGRYRFIHILLRKYFADSEPYCSQTSRQPKTSQIAVALVTISLFLFCILLPFVVDSFVADRSNASSEKIEAVKSMIHTHDALLIDMLTYRFAHPQRGDLVVFNSPKSWSQKSSPSQIRLVMGLPGETVEVKGGKIYINGQPLPRNTVGVPIVYKRKLEWLPDNFYLVLGDNSNYSGKAPFGERVRQNDIIGRVAFRYWTPHRLGAVGKRL